MEGCLYIYLSAAGCEPLRLQHYQAQREMAPLVLLNSTVLYVHIYFVILFKNKQTLINMAHSTNIMAVKLLGFTVYVEETNTFTQDTLAGNLKIFTKLVENNFAEITFVNTASHCILGHVCYVGCVKASKELKRADKQSVWPTTGTNTQD